MTTSFTEADARGYVATSTAKSHPRVRVLGVGARACESSATVLLPSSPSAAASDGHPLVLICHPLRTTATVLAPRDKGRFTVVDSSADGAANGEGMQEATDMSDMSNNKRIRKDSRGGSKRKGHQSGSCAMAQPLLAC